MQSGASNAGGSLAAASHQHHSLVEQPQFGRQGQGLVASAASVLLVAVGEVVAMAASKARRRGWRCMA